MPEPSLLNQLVDALKCMPGIGPKSAQRIALYLMERDRPGAERLGRVMLEAVEKIGHCQRCRTLTEQRICRLCADPRRDPTKLCVVETPGDVLALELATEYRGLYFVLLGKLSPLDGIGPEEIGLDLLEMRLKEGEVQEIILATNPTIEGEVTAQYIHQMATELIIETTRIAHGVPIGGELEYTDSGTLAHAFDGRKKY